MKKRTITALLTAMMITAIGAVPVYAEEVSADTETVEATETVAEAENADEALSGSAVSNETAGIYIASLDANGLTAGVVLDPTVSTSNLEFRWLAYNEDAGTWNTVQDWTVGNEWLNWKPDTYGKYVIQVEVREAGTTDSISASTGITYHPNIIGKCQMPYTGEGGGYLIGVESADNQNYSYELLVLDCTKLTAGDPNPWIYTSGQQKVSGNAFWTVWQPQYGYYWTLFRVYDANGNLIDEDCYGFENTQTEQTAASGQAGADTAATNTSTSTTDAGNATAEVKPLDEWQKRIIRRRGYYLDDAVRASLMTYNYAVAQGAVENGANSDLPLAYSWGKDVMQAVDDRGSVQAVVNEFGYDFLLDDQWIAGYEAYFN